MITQIVRGEPGLEFGEHGWAVEGRVPSHQPSCIVNWFNLPRPHTYKPILVLSQLTNYEFMERHCGVLHGLINQKVVKEVSRYAWGEDSGIIQSVQFIYYTNKLNPALTDPSVSNFISPKSNMSKCGRAIAILIKQSGRRFLRSNYS